MLVYAGGIVVLYLFVVMLVNLKRPPEAHEDPHRRTEARVRAVGRGARRARRDRDATATSRPAPALAAQRACRSPATPRKSGWLLYTSYLIPFEIASMLLLVAMIGAIVLAKREL